MSTTTTAPIDKPGSPANPQKAFALKPESDPRPDGGSDPHSPGPKPN